MCRTTAANGGISIQVLITPGYKRGESRRRQRLLKQGGGGGSTVCAYVWCTEWNHARLVRSVLNKIFFLLPSLIHPSLPPSFLLVSTSEAPLIHYLQMQKRLFFLAKNQREKVTSRKNISTPPSPLPRPASIYSLSSSHSIKSSFYFVLFPNLVFFHIIISFRFHSFSSSSPPSSD